MMKNEILKNSSYVRICTLCTVLNLVRAHMNTVHSIPERESINLNDEENNTFFYFEFFSFFHAVRYGTY